ncbi:lysozyme inhibitor LprI family protein [Rhizobium sp.]|jgi:uncharacterized protein YecT (DUF1311 family)|uniref:lysozyme inhibitor LprI family protein n=1 Tax=Rhizobium sp. TaxID=391 RepID=UPI000E851D35|nr:urease-associated protein [Rhizobium sp.]
MRMALSVLVCLLAGAGSAYAVGPKLDCNNAQTQSDMNQCAADDLANADKALNAQWKLTRAVLVDADTNLDAAQKGGEKALLKAQRAWIDYRDGQCEAEGFSVRGGSMEPMMVASCKARLTEVRTKELKAMAEPQ